ncbi:MAG: hypothetical protein HY814_01370 [Candidatus Riflebacteria bacterium]|nr:hypothetical protein [Candidatus Riflebacteria bacterium]
MTRITKWTCSLAVTGALFTLSAARSAAEIPDFDGLERVGRRVAQVASQQPAERRQPLRLDPTAPNARWAMTEDGKLLARGSHFRVELDTPDFGNFAAFNRESGSFGGFNCHGVNLVAVDWFRTFVLPIKDRSVADRLLDPSGPVIESELAPGHRVTAQNLSQYRLKRFSAQKSRQEALRRLAHRNQDDQTYLFAKYRKLPGQDAFDRIQADLSDDARQVALINMADAKSPNGHSLLAYEVRHGTASSSNGTWLEARKVLFYDPNTPILDGKNGPENYLLYFPLAEAFVGSPRWNDNYTADGLPAAPGARIFLTELGYNDVHSASNSGWRAVWNAPQGEREPWMSIPLF